MLVVVVIVVLGSVSLTFTSILSLGRISAAASLLDKKWKDFTRTTKKNVVFEKHLHSNKV